MNVDYAGGMKACLIVNNKGQPITSRYDIVVIDKIRYLLLRGEWIETMKIN